MTVDLDMVAAEYVLGTLDREERLAFVARIQSDAAARAAVARWDARLAGLIDRLPEIAPPHHVWEGIERSLGWRPAATPLRVVQGGKTGPEIPPQLQRSLRRWRATAVVSSGLAAALVTFIAIRELQSQPQDDTYVAAVNRGGDKPAMLVHVDLKTHRIVIIPVAAEAPADKSLELWYIGAGQPPRSMGLVDRTAKSMPMPEDMHSEAATFAVSVEPKGGSTSSGPTGPVVYSGQLIRD